jgi:hypothetical protein
LRENWGFKVADDFLDGLYERINKLKEIPRSGSPTAKNKNIRKIIISRHNKVYYRIKGNVITILTLIESRQDPKKNKYE